MKNKFLWTPARLTGLSFLSLITIGAALLSLPIATTGSNPSSFIDALFTAVSATCVTGLIVQDTPVFFSSFGHMVIMCLIQLGGLGIMTLSAALPMIFGRNLKVSQRSMFQGMFGQDDYVTLKNTIIKILQYTMVIEALGALGLTLRWYALWGDFQKALYYGVFHSVSAFCNAGFALFSDNMMSFQNDNIILSIIMMLSFLGSLGFVVLIQIFTFRHLKEYTFHTKFVLLITSFMVLLPSIFIFFNEFSNAFFEFPISKKIQLTLFHVLTGRTAGFNAIDLNDFSDATLFILMIKMFIGGAPGSCAGGIKVTTIGILFLSIRSILLGRENIEIMGRRISQGQVTKSIAVLFVSFSIITFLMIILMMVEPLPFKTIFFETLSAFGTVGWSLGITPQLSDIGKIIISIAMYIGRIGPITLVFLIGSQDQKLYYRYPTGRIMIG